MEGRRRPDTGSFDREGDYCVVYNDAGLITTLWFSLPHTGQWGRIIAEASTEEGPKWKITEDAEGRVTVEPSIHTVWRDAEGDQEYHGFLRGGVWSDA